MERLTTRRSGVDIRDLGRSDWIGPLDAIESSPVPRGRLPGIRTGAGAIHAAGAGVAADQGLKTKDSITGVASLTSA